MSQEIVSYGWDGHGFSTADPICKACFADSSISLSYISKTPLTSSFGSGDTYNLKKASQCLDELLEKGVLVIDSPVNLQDFDLHKLYNHHIDCVQDEIRVWEFYHRPIDRVLGGMRPLASNIGVFVLFIQSLLKYQCDGEVNICELDVYESYPKALQQTGCSTHVESVTKTIKDGSDSKLNDDQIDSALCALAGIMYQRDEATYNLSDIIENTWPESDLNNDSYPDNYLLLSHTQWCDLSEMNIEVD